MTDRFACHPLLACRPSLHDAALLGAGKQAELLIDLLEWSGLEWRSLTVYDDRLPPGAAGPRGLMCEGDLDAGVRRITEQNLPAVVALGSKQAALRDCLHEAILTGGAALPVVMHPGTLIAPSAVVGPGATIYAGCVIGPRVQIGRGATLCQGVVLEHDTVVGDNAWLAPRSATSGFVEIGRHVFLGAGAMVTREARIGDRSLVGAGAVVISDLPSDCIAFGSPARVQGPVRPGMDAPLASDWQGRRQSFQPPRKETSIC